MTNNAITAEQALNTSLPTPKPEQVNNSLGTLVGSLNGVALQSAQLSQTDTLWRNNRWYLVTNNRQLLSELYVEHGIVQTLVDQPVDDAFRAGFEIQTGQLSKDEIETLEQYIEREGVIKKIVKSAQWARLFGGGGVLIITDQDPTTPLDLNQLKEGANIDFRAVDLWELYNQNINVHPAPEAGGEPYADESEFYSYYGRRVHKSRVYAINGKQAPSFVRPRLRGWGVSEIERLIRSINQYLKNQNVVFDLIDEAKIDIYKIKGLNSALLSNQGTNGISQRIEMSNMVKSYMHAIVMDTDDEYEQKQMNFAGLAEVMSEIRMQVAADLKMPMTKLFGMSSAGFNSGEDDIENYNSMLESEIRSKTKHVVIDMLGLCCIKLFGYRPDDLMIEFNPLRILSAKEEEEVKNYQFNRIMSAYQSGSIDRQIWAQAINKNNLLPIEVDETMDALEPLDGQFLTGVGTNVDS